MEFYPSGTVQVSVGGGRDNAQADLTILQAAPSKRGGGMRHVVIFASQLFPS